MTARPSSWGASTGGISGTQTSIDFVESPVPSTAVEHGALFVGDGTGGTVAGALYFRAESDGALTNLLEGGSSGTEASGWDGRVGTVPPAVGDYTAYGNTPTLSTNNRGSVGIAAPSTGGVYVASGVMKAGAFGGRTILLRGGARARNLDILFGVYYGTALGQGQGLYMWDSGLGLRQSVIATWVYSAGGNIAAAYPLFSQEMWWRIVLTPTHSYLLTSPDGYTWNLWHTMTAAQDVFEGYRTAEGVPPALAGVIVTNRTGTEAMEWAIDRDIYDADMDETTMYGSVGAEIGTGGMIGVQSVNGVTGTNVVLTPAILGVVGRGTDWATPSISTLAYRGDDDTLLPVTVAGLPVLLLGTSTGVEQVPVGEVGQNLINSDDWIAAYTALGYFLTGPIPGATSTLDLEDGLVQSVALGSDTTVTIDAGSHAAFPAGTVLLLELAQDVTGGWQATFDTTYFAGPIRGPRLEPSSVSPYAFFKGAGGKFWLMGEVGIRQRVTALTTVPVVASDHNTEIVTTAATGVGATLPARSGLPAGYRVTIRQRGAGTVTVGTTGGDVIFWDPSTPAGSSTYVFPSQFVCVTFVNGATGWEMA